MYISMIFGSRNSKNINLISLAGHLSTLERHEASQINEEIASRVGMDSISSSLKDLGFIIGDKISNDEMELLRSDGTKIRNAYLSGNHEGMRVVMKEPFSPTKDIQENKKSLRDLVEQSKYGPGHLYELFNEEN